MPVNFKYTPNHYCPFCCIYGLKNTVPLYRACLSKECKEKNCDDVLKCTLYINKKELEKIIKNKEKWAVQHLQSDNYDYKTLALFIIKNRIVWN